MVLNRNRRTIETTTHQLFDKNQWIQHARFKLGEGKQAALKSWAQQEKRIENDGIEYAVLVTHRRDIEYYTEYFDDASPAQRRMDEEAERIRLRDIMAENTSLALRGEEVVRQ